MGENVIFVKPVEKVGVIYDILRASTHSNFAVVDKLDGDILLGTLGRNELVLLLREREFGLPDSTDKMSQAHYLEADGSVYVPLIPWKKFVGGAKIGDGKVKGLRISEKDREFLVDLRPYINTAPITVNEFSSIEVSSNIRENHLTIKTAHIRHFSELGPKVSTCCEPVQPMCWHNITFRLDTRCISRSYVNERKETLLDFTGLRRRNRTGRAVFLQYKLCRVDVCRILHENA